MNGDFLGEPMLNTFTTGPNPLFLHTAATAAASAFAADQAWAANYFTTSPSTTPPKEHYMNTTTRTVELITGYKGQIVYREVIVWQSKAYKSRDKALLRTEQHRDARVADVFA
jgi:hypothetical protein